VNDCEVVTLPNVLGGDVLPVEQFYAALAEVPKAKQYILDAKHISFVKPYGIIALLLATRQLAAHSEYPLQLKNIPSNIHSYLQRMNFFNVSHNWLTTPDTLEESWARSAYTPNLLEITVISNSDDVLNIVSRASRIFSRWLILPDLNGLLSVISELCANVYEHSQDQLGCVLIQKHSSEQQGYVQVHLSVGDIGCGIRGSLAAIHKDIGPEPIKHLLAVMQGRTSRQTGRGGLGLPRVEQIVRQQNGYLWIRSETAALLRRGANDLIQKTSLTYLPGTQIAIGFQAPLSS